MKKLLIIAMVCMATIAQGQDSVFARKVVDTLTSKYFWGRGYTNDGMAKAAQYLSEQYKIFGLESFSGKSYLQNFTYPVNTFPGKMEIVIDGKLLQPGRDFIISHDSKGFKGEVVLTKKDSTHFINEENKVVVSLENKLTWSVAPGAEDFTTIKVDRKAINQDPVLIKINIENKINNAFKASNVCGYVKGTRQPDSLVVFTAHYDHLGGMGNETYFAGANDNASGVALLLGLAKHYALNPPPYSVAFICFAGEEAGLLGSKYFTEHPMWDLKKTKFLTNVDLVGTGIEGITVVNATEYPKEFVLLKDINHKEHLVAKINARGKAANSDHYWFSEKGVPAFFIYTLGGVKAYHDIYDVSATLPLNEYEDLFKLIVGFNSKLMAGY